MKKIKHFETTSGTITKVAYLDAYAVYDKLEGSLFQVDVTDNGTLEVTIYERDKDFFESFNSDKCLEDATEYINDRIEDDYLGLITLDEEECEVIFDEVIENDTEPVEESKIGKFTTKRQLLNFVSAVNGMKVRLLSNFAFIDGAQLSGILDDTKFKFTIKENNTLDVEEIGTSKSNDEMIQRLLNDIDETDVTGYANKFVISGLEFENEKGGRMYLEVEHEKPYDKLKSLFDEPVEETVISESASSFLDLLFSNDNETNIEVEAVESEAETEVDVIKSTPALSYMEESFRKINGEKVNELKTRIEDAEKNIMKYRRDISQSEKSINTESKRLTVLQTRLDTFDANEESTGYVFQVSDAKHTERELSESEMQLLKDLGTAIGAQAEQLAKALTNNMFVIKLAKKDNFEDKKMTQEAFQSLRKIDLNGSIVPTQDGEFEYRGKMNWHQVVAQLIKKGFEQDPEFEKFAGSNSYEVEQPEPESNMVDLGNGVFGVLPEKISDEEENFEKGDSVVFVGVSNLDKLINGKTYTFYRSIGDGAEITDEDINNPTNTIMILDKRDIMSLEKWKMLQRDEKLSNVINTDKNTFAQKKYRTFTEPTDIVILGTTDADDGRDIEITDDYTSFEIRVNGKRVKTIESDGFVSILTVDEYKKWRSKMISDGGLDGTERDQNFGVDALLIQGYQGILGIGVFSDELGYITDFDESSYICHDDRFEEDYPTVFANFDGGVNIHDIKGHDLNKILSYVRDVTLEKVLQ